MLVGRNQCWIRCYVGNVASTVRTRSMRVSRQGVLYSLEDNSDPVVSE